MTDFCRTNQGATLSGVSDQVVELSFVGHQPPSQPFSVGLGFLCELADVISRDHGLQEARPQFVSRRPRWLHGLSRFSGDQTLSER